MYIKSMIEPEIATVSRHMFLYGKNTHKREKLLKGISEKYPFYFNEDKESVIYIDDIGLPEIKDRVEFLDEDKVNIVANHYLEFSVVKALLEKVLQGKNRKPGNDEALIREFNLFSQKKHESLDEIMECLNVSKQYWANYYETYLRTGDDSIPREYFSKLDMAFIPFLSSVTEEIQDATNNHKPFQVVLDRKSKISLSSVKAINSLLGLRCNGSVSYKVACEVDEWETTHDFHGGFAEYIHDYTTLELDDSLEKELKRLRKEYEYGDY